MPFVGLSTSNNFYVLNCTTILNSINQAETIGYSCQLGDDFETSPADSLYCVDAPYDHYIVANTKQSYNSAATILNMQQVYQQPVAAPNQQISYNIFAFTSVMPNMRMAG